MLHVERRGHGPAIIFVSGLGGIGAFWRPVMDSLQDAFRVITFDHPGTGRSPASGPQSIDGLVTAVLDIANADGLDTFAVVGHSTGGLVGQALALDHADRLDALVLSCTWARPDRHFLDLFALRRRILNDLGLGAYKAHGNLLAYPPADYDRHVSTGPRFSEQGDPVEVATTAARIDMLTGYSRADELGTITTPTLVVGSVDDQIAPFCHSQQLAHLLGTQLDRMDGGHFPPLTRTDAYVASLRAFLDRSR